MGQENIGSSNSDYGFGKKRTENKNQDNGNKKLKSVIFVTGILLLATFVAYPHQAAMGHNSGWHDFCFEQTVTAGDVLVDIALKLPIPPPWFAVVVAIAAILALAISLTFPVVCSPELVPPPQTANSPGTFVECNTVESDLGSNFGKPGWAGTSGGTKFFGANFNQQELRNATEGYPYVGGFLFTPFILVNGLFVPQISSQSDQSDSEIRTKTIGPVLSISGLISWLVLILSSVFGLIVGGLSPEKTVGKVLQTIAGIAGGVIGGIASSALNYKTLFGSFIPPTRPYGLTSHILPWNVVTKVTTGKISDFYPLGLNKIQYESQALASPFGDKAPFIFNVIDSSYPLIVFENDTVVLEANAHWGWKYDSLSKAELGGIEVLDDCRPFDNDKQLKLDYVGKDFYPLSNIWGEQRTIWTAKEGDYKIATLGDSVQQNLALGAFGQFDVAREYAKFMDSCTEIKNNNISQSHPYISDCHDLLAVKPGFNSSENLYGLDRSEALSIIKENESFPDARKSNNFGKLIWMNFLGRAVTVDTVNTLIEQDAHNRKKFEKALINILNEDPKNTFNPEISKVSLRSDFTGLDFVETKLSPFEFLASHVDINNLNKTFPNVPVPPGNNFIDPSVGEGLVGIAVAGGIALGVEGTKFVVTEVLQKILDKRFKQKIIDKELLDGPKPGDYDEIVKKGDAPGAVGSALLGKVFNVGAAAGVTLVTEILGGPPQIETIKIPGFVSLGEQRVIVQDTLAPDILVLENIALEVNSTHPSTTEHPLLTDAGCFDLGLVINCEMAIKPPIVFDIADPLPQLQHNKTLSDMPEILEDDELITSFILPKAINTTTTSISWTATDFSNNTSDDVIQLVTLKFNGTNLGSIPSNVTVPNANFTQPIVIQVNATNPDNDPLQFELVDSPDEGVVESPIDAVFQNKFQKEGTISILKGITNDPTSRDIYFTDSQNQRVMKVDDNNVLLRGFDASVSERPEAISMTGNENEFVISDWFNKPSNQTIVVVENTDGVGKEVNRFNVTGLFESPKNISVDRKTGDIWVADNQNNTVSKLDDTLVNFPVGLAITNTQLLISDTENNRILFVDKITGIPNKEIGQGGLNSPAGIAVNGTHFFVADTGNNQAKIFRHNSTTPDKTIGGLNSPAGIAVNGTHFFVADTGNNQAKIFRHNSTTPDKTIGGLNSPAGIAVNGTHFFVADTGNNQAKIFRHNSTTPDKTIGGLNSPAGIAVNGTHFFVADTGNNQAKIFRHNSTTPDKTFGMKGKEDGSFNHPTGIVVDAITGKIYVSDTENNRFQIFDSFGNFLGKTISKINSRVDNFVNVFPFSVSGLVADTLDIDSNGKFVVGDWNNKRIVMMDPLGGQIPIVEIGESFTDPKNLAINNLDHIFVTDDGADSIIVLDEFGAEIDRFDDYEFSLDGISINGSHIFVSDWDDDLIHTLEIDGTFSGEILNVTSVFSQPRDISVSDNSTVIWVTENAGEKIVQIRRDKGMVDEFELFSNPLHSKGIELTSKTNVTTNQVIFFNSTDGFVRIFDMETFEIKNLFDDPLTTVEPSDIAINPRTYQFAIDFVNNGAGELIAPTGLTFGIDGNLYVISSLTNSINRYNGTSGEFIDNFIENHQSLVGHPSDLEFGPDGNLYVSNQDLKSILRFNGTTGEFIDEFTTYPPLSQPTGFTFIGPPLNGTAALYVASSGTNSIYAFNATDGKPFVFGNLTNPPGLLVNATSSDNGFLDYPFDLIFDPLGNLYVSSFSNGAVKHYVIPDYDPFSHPKQAVYMGDTVPEGTLDGPSGLALGPDNTLFVSQMRDDQILRYNLTSGDLLGPFSFFEANSPQFIANGPDGKIFVSSYGTNEVLRYGFEDAKYFVSDWITDGERRIIGITSKGNLTDVEFNLSSGSNPQHIATDSLGNIWITYSEGSNSRIEKIRSVDGSILKNISLQDIPVVQPTNSSSFTTGNGTSMQIDPETGEELEEETIETISIEPTGISVDSSDNLYIADWQNNRIIKLLNNGLFNHTFKVNSTFVDPVDLAIEEINGTNNLNFYVSENSNNKLIKIQSDKLIKEFDVSNSANSLNGIAFEDEKLLFTSPPNGTIFEINSTDHIAKRTKFFVEPEGISVFNSSRIFVSDWKDERVLIIDQYGERIGPPIDMSPAMFVSPVHLRDIEVNPDMVDFRPLLVWTSDSRTASIANLTERQDPDNSTKFVIDKFRFDEVRTVADKFVVGSSIAVDSHENFIFASTGNNTLIKFNERGKLLQNYTVPESYSLIDVSAAVDPISLDDVYYLVVQDLTSSANNKIVKFNSTLDVILDSGKLGYFPTSVSAYSNGTLYVSTNSSQLIQFDSNLIQTGTFINLPEGEYISDIGIDSNNNLYAVDLEAHRIHKILPNGAIQGWLGKCDVGLGCFEETKSSKGFSCTDSTCNVFGDKFGNRAGQFNNPSDITVDSSGNIFLADGQKLPGKPLAPRIQKFSDKGFFVQQTLSDTEKSKIKGNFNLPKGIAIGTNNFYVLDNSTLHVFDVNPFFDIFTDKNQGVTFANVSYIANQGFVGLDNFTYRVDDGFDQSTIASVNVTVGDCFVGSICNDAAIFDTKDLSDFGDQKNGDTTEGRIISPGGQKIIVRDATDASKGVFIQASVNSTSDIPAVIDLCNMATVFAETGDQIIATCDDTKTTIESFRGTINSVFYDNVGRNSTISIPIADIVTFDLGEYSFLSDKSNGNILNSTVLFNGIVKTYLIGPGNQVKVDTAKPDLISTCPKELTLEAETNFGVNNNSTSESWHMIKKFLNFPVDDVDNGIPKLSNSSLLTLSNDSPELFPYDSLVLVNFTAVDDAGNTSTCSAPLTIEDTISPKVDVAGIPGLDDVTSPPVLKFLTPSHQDSVNILFEKTKVNAIDLPDKIGGPPTSVVSESDNPLVCILPSGSSIPIGSQPIVCQITDNSINSNMGSGFFRVEVNANSTGVVIKNILASDQNSDGSYSEGDVIIIKFSQPTSKPPVDSKENVDNFLSISNPIGKNYTGIWMDPSNLILKITETADKPPSNSTFFTIKDNSLSSASGTLSGNPIIISSLSGNFTSRESPFITGLIADDPVMFEGQNSTGSLHLLDDLEYSIDDTLTIRFSESTNQPFGLGVHVKSVVEKIFDFSSWEPGDDYTGRWINPSTYKITIKDMNSLVSKDPIIGQTQITVKETAQLKSTDEESLDSVSTSPPLTGFFGPFTSSKNIVENGTFAVMMPSGIPVEVTFPVENNGTSISRGPDLGGLEKFVGETVDIQVEETTCDLGCKVEYTFTNSDFSGSLNGLTIFHDSNQDNFIEKNEVVDTVFENKGFGITSAKGTIFSTSVVGLGILETPRKGGGGGFGDQTAPEIKSFSYLGDPNLGLGGVFVEEILFYTDMPTAKVGVGHPAKFILRVFDDSGHRSLQHISLYTNIRSILDWVADSDTYIRYDMGKPVIIKDPNGFIEKADVSIIPRDTWTADVIFEITFAKPMEKSDVIFRVWDEYVNSQDTKFIESIEILESEEGATIEESPILSSNQTEIKNPLQELVESLISSDVFDKWAGFSSEAVSDEELLEQMGINGKTIPSWYKNVIPNWIKDGEITLEDFVIALKFFNERGLLE